MITLRIFSACLGLVAAVCCIAAPVARESALAPQFFGWITHLRHTATAWPSVEFGTWRMWDSYLKWTDIESKEGVFDFSKFDLQVSIGEQHGKELIYTLGQTPRWASSRPDDQHGYGKGTGAMPVSLDLWRRYVSHVFSRYKGRIMAYDIWNEPKYADVTGRCGGAISFCGTAGDLVRLTEVAAEELRRIDPGALLTSPGFTDGKAGVARLDEYLGKGGAKYINVIAFHFYSRRPEEAFETIRMLRGVLEKHGLGRLPIWDIEHGYPIQSEREPFVDRDWPIVFSARVAAELMVRSHIVEASTGVDRIVWYAWDNKHFGVMETLDGRPNAVAGAYERMRGWLLGAKVGCADQPTRGVWRCWLSRGERIADVIWSDSELSNRDMAEGRVGKIRVESLFDEPRQLGASAESDFKPSLALIPRDGRPW